MNQKSSVGSGTASSLPELKPPLAAALASLEVQLDQELSRYRRTRFAYRTPNKTTAEEIIPPLPATEDITELLNHQPNLDPGSIVPSVTSTLSENPPEPEEKTNTQPENYLESSEALLRSFTEEKPATPKPANNSDNFISPLGIGSILLLLLSSLTLGYVFFNPKSLSHFSLNGLVPHNSSTSDTKIANTNISPSPTPLLTPVPKYPNLARDEFPEVTSPNDIAGLKPKPIVTPSPKPTVAKAKPVTPAPNKTITSAPIFLTQPPAPQTTPQTLAEIKPSADGFYHIVMDNSENNSFAFARKAIPDAYLSPDGKLIYLGAVKNKTQVQQLLSRLESKGIKARIQQP